MDTYNDLKDMLCEELDSIAKKGELSTGELDVIDKLTHSIKSLVTIMAMDENGYSGQMNSYRNGNSYARRGGRGRYSRDGRSYRGGYSRDEKEIRSRIEDMMEDAEDDHVREVLRNAVSQLN